MLYIIFHKSKPSPLKIKTMTNKERVQSAYGHFANRNIPAILELLSDDVIWELRGPSVIPFAGSRKGKEGAMEFFNQLGTSSDFQSFTPQEFIEEGNTVVALGEAIATSRETGKTAHNYWAMVWTFRDGKVIHYRNYSDTYDLAQSFM
jgi:hypothetical protein